MTERLPSPLLPLAVLAAALSACVSPGVTATVHRDPARLQEIVGRPDHGGEDLDGVMGNAIAFDCADCVRVLLKAGAAADAGALSAAAAAGREAIARILIDAGADPVTAMALVHAQTRKWVGGAGFSPQQAEVASALFKKLDRERAAASDAAAPVAAPPPAAPDSAPPAPARPAGPPIVPSFRETRRPDDYAVVVGVEEYEGRPAAAFAERDAQAVAAFAAALGVPAAHVVALTGPRATRAALAKRLEGWLPDDVDADSTVYFYFAGRGAAGPGGETYLMPSDGDEKYLELTAYPLKRLYAKLGALKARRAIVLLDADLPGPVDAGFDAVDGKVALLAAADAGRSAGTDDAAGYGLFTRFLLEGLDGPAKDASGQVTLRSLFDYAKPRVMDAARAAGRRQLPVFESGGTATDDVALRSAAR